jgi:tetratricopeptide (TPR) repeat protein
VRLVAALALIGLAASRAHAVPDPAPADDQLAEAIRLESALEYEQALAIVERLIAGGTTTVPARLAELHLYAGRLAAGLDRPDVAGDHFARALALRPDLALPAGTSPKITAPFDDARAHSTPLRLRITPTGPVTESDVLGLVHHIDGFTAYDAHGNVVWRGTPPEQPPPRAPQHEPGVAGRTSTWLAIGGGALVIGGLCAWRFQVAQDDWNTASQDGLHDLAQLRAIEARGDHWGLGANVGFGVAAAAGVTAVILYATHRNAPIFVGDHSVGVAARF